MNIVLTTYPGYKSSGVEWLGDVPEHWGLVRVKHAVKINPEVLSEDTDPEYLFDYMDINSVSTGYMSTPPVRQVFGNAPSRARRVMRTGDTAISTVRTYLKAAYHLQRDWPDLIASTGFAVLRPPVRIVPALLGHIVQSDAFVRQVVANSVGVAYPAISETKLGTLLLVLPPLPEQASIVRYLDHVGRRILRYVSAKRKLIALLEEEKQAVVNRAVTRGLDPNIRLKPSGVEWLGDVPEHWAVRTLGQAADSFRTGPFGSMLHQSDYVEDGTPVINPVHMRDGTIVEDPRCTVSEVVADRLSSYRLGLHDIVFSRRGDLGRCALVHSRETGWLCGTGSIRVRIDYRDIEPEFLIRALQVRRVGEYLSLVSVGATMANLNTGILKSIPLLVPPIQEQRDLLECIGRRSRTIGAEIVRARRQIELLQEYRTKLIADVVTGKLDVCEAAAQLPDETHDQDPIEESGPLTDGIAEASTTPMRR